MCKKLILLLIVFGVIAGFSSVASALPLIGNVVRSGGQTDDRDPIGPYNGETQPLATQEGGWTDGNYVFSDRTYTWANTPDEIDGAEQIRTFNSDKEVSTVTYTVTFPIGATVLLTADDRLGNLQDAVDAVVSDFASAGTFTDTGLDVFVGGDGDPPGRQLSVFSAVVEPGTYVFGAMESGRNFYIIGALEPPVPMRKAYSPIPANESRTPPSGPEGDGFYMLLQFTAGYGATTHTAYFSDVEQDVIDRNPAVSLGSPPYPDPYETGYFVGMDDPLVPEFARTPLDRGITYYWVVDESNDTTTVVGDVWSFMIASEKAWNPAPADDAVNVIGDPNVDLSWQLGDINPDDYIISYDVFYGADEATVTTAATPDDHVTTTSLEIAVDGDQDYYWRVDTLLADNGPPFGTRTVEGDVWHFKTLFSAPEVDPHLIAWWKLDGGFDDLVFDWSGHANHGTLMDDAQFVPGLIDNAIDLDGASQYVTVPNSAGLNLTKNFTIGAWIYPNVVAGSHGIVTKCEGSSHKQYVLTISDGVLRFEYELSGNNYSMSGGTVAAGQWQYVTITIDDSLLINLYVDGVVTASETADGEVLAQSNPVAIGRWSGSYNDYYFDGLIDDVKVYDIVTVPTGPSEATNPDPANGATDVSRTPTLNWLPGAFAAAVNGNILYYGEDLSAVLGRTATNVPLSGPLYAVPITLDLGASFYWAVDTVNGVETWPGDLWSFTTTDWIYVDDMESYTPWTVSGNNIFEAYRDGMGNCTTGNGNDTGSNLTENADPVFEGFQSMKYDYDNDGMVFNPCTMAQTARLYKYSKVEAQIAGLTSGIGTDWTVQGVKALSLRFYGSTLNNLEPMWVQLQDATGYGEKVTYGDYEDEDTNAITEESWHEWFIDMADFDVDPANLVSISIGFGNEDGSGTHGSGTVYFDAIRLYTPRCFAARHSEEFAKVDFAPLGAPDCVVNYKELDVMANDWLLTDTLETGELLVRWEFNDAVGTTAADTSGNARHGDVNDVNGVSWVYDTTRGWCLDFAGGDYVLDNDANEYLNDLHGLTISVWVKNRETTATDQGFIIFEDPANNDDRDMRYDAEGGNGGGVSVIKCGVTTTSAVGEPIQQLESSEYAQTTAWQHLALTWSTGEQLKLYIDGVLDTPTANRPGTYGVTTGATKLIVGKGGKGNVANGGWNGLIDDVQIYNYALSATEIATVKAGGAIAPKPMHYPAPSPAEIHEGEAQGSRAVNFKDYAELMDSWLLELKYPQ